MSVRFAIEPLAKAHKRDDFTCGNDRIDGYFRETVSQDVKRKYATCFVAIGFPFTAAAVGFAEGVRPGLGETAGDAIAAGVALCLCDFFDGTT